MHKLIPFILLCFPSLVFTQSTGQNYALFFANDDYRSNPDFGDLKNPVGDALAIEKELREMFGFITEFHENNNEVV